MLTEDDIGNLWVRMAKIYGHKWSSNFGDCDDGTWLAGLCDLTQSELSRGIQEMFRQKLPWPPNLMEFRAMCKPKREECHKVFPKTIEPPRNPTIGEATLAQVRKILRPRCADPEAIAEREAIQQESA